MNVQAMIETLRAAREEALETAARCADAIALFEGHGVVARKPAAKATKAPKTTKAAKPTARAKKAPKKAPVADDTPRTVKGQMPRVGVEQKLCNGLKERWVAINALKENGYFRVSPGQPLAPGTFYVWST